MDFEKLMFWKSWGQSAEPAVQDKKPFVYQRHMTISSWYVDSIESLEGQQKIDTKWLAPASAVMAKTPAPGSISVDEAKKLLEESSPGMKESLKVSELLNSDNLEAKIEKISKMIDEELKKSDRSFEKLQALVYCAVMGLMNKFKQVDQEFISETGVQIRLQSIQVKDSYNTWPAVAVTLVGSAVGIFGGAAGLAPLAPISWINAQTAHVFAGASQSIGTAGTGLSGVGSIFNSKGEADRGWRQTYIGEITKKREDKEGSKNNKAQRGNEARGNVNEFNRMLNETISRILQS